jgi:cytidylate kinase
VRQQLLDWIYAGQPFREVLRDLGLTPNQVWGLTKTDPEWSETLDTALTATRRDDLEHGTNAAYVHGCVCSECRAHQRIRMAKNL